MRIIKIFEHIFLSLCLCSSYFVYKHLSNSDLTNLSEMWFFPKLPKIERKEASDLFSSVSCRGSNHTNRFCHFQNLCFDPNCKLFLFFHSAKSIMTGLPQNRFSPTLVDFSSVSDHNTLYFNYVELPSNSISRFNLSYVMGHGLMFKRFNPDNLMHVFHDDLLPVFTTVNEIPSDDIFLIFADNRSPGPYAILYEEFLTRKPIYISSLSNKLIHCFQNVHIGLNKHSTWYQYGFKEPQGPLLKTHNEVSPLILNFRDYFMKQFALVQHSTKSTALLLVRKHNRKISNEIEIANAIANFTGLETKLIGLEDKSVLQVIQEIIHSPLLVGMHGSLLILSLFLNPFSVVLEMFPFGIDPGISTPYRTLSGVPGLKLLYRSWQNINITNSIPHPEYPKELGGVLHLPLEEQKVIQNSTVKPFLCCDDPVWLYRIYQDTYVDLLTFQAVLEEVLETRQKMLSSSETFKGYGLYPSEVQNIACTVIFETNTTLTFSWDEPWNLTFMNSTVVEYEVWIQTADGVQAYIMKKNVFKYPIKSEMRTCYTWIRCYIDGRIGPFNSSPFICAW